MGNPGPLRISDAERDQAARELREHFAAGRITTDELGERLASVYAASTTDELSHVRRDLPALAPSPAIARAELAQRRAHLQRQLLQQTGGSLGLFVVCLVVWFADGAQGSFWPVYTLVFPVLALVRNGWALYGPAPELDRVEAELSRQRHGRGHHHGRHSGRRLGPGPRDPNR
jgi:hypothetical protein